MKNILNQIIINNQLIKDNVSINELMKLHIDGDLFSYPTIICINHNLEQFILYGEDYESDSSNINILLNKINQSSKNNILNNILFDNFVKPFNLFTYDNNKNTIIIDDLYEIFVMKSYNIDLGINFDEKIYSIYELK